MRCSVGVAKRIPSLRAGRGVRWTFEVSADVDPTGRPRVRTTTIRKRSAKAAVKSGDKPVAKRPRVQAAPPAEPAPAADAALLKTGPHAAAPVAAPPVAAPPVTATPVAAPPVTPPPVAAVPVMAVPVVNKAAPPPLSAVPLTTRRQGMILIGAAVLIVAAVAFPRKTGEGSGPLEQRQPADTVRGAAQPAGAPASAPAAVPPAAQSAVASVAPAVVTPAPASEPLKKSPAQAAPKRAAAAKSPAPVAAPPVVAETAKKEEAPPPAPVEPAAPAAEAAGNVAPGLVTITGCLEISTDGDTFRLTDAEGADVPKSRSWRSGFFKKRPAPVMLAEPLDRVSLKSNVGKRVAATGHLANRDLRVNSLRVVGPSCN